MPEKTGTVTGFIQKKDGTNFGLHLDGQEYLYSFPDKRGKPWGADKVNVGDTVRIEYSPYEKDGKTKQYIAVIDLCTAARSSPIPVPASGTFGPPRAESSWAFEQKDKLGLMQTCLNVVGNMWTASLNAGSAPKVPEPTTVAASARALWKLVLADIEPEETQETEYDGEIPFE